MNNILIWPAPTFFLKSSTKRGDHMPDFFIPYPTLWLAILPDDPVSSLSHMYTTAPEENDDVGT
jgi:hypothetical protein